MTAIKDEFASVGMSMTSKEDQKAIIRLSGFIF
jgi:hypothetical protein